MGNNHERINLFDLQSILRHNIGKELEVLEFKVSNLLPAGENYCSVIVKIEAVIRRTEKSKQEKLYLVAKTGNDQEKFPLTWSKAFRKEVFFYNELIPKYRELESVIRKNDLFSGLPYFYGYGDSVNDKSRNAPAYSVLLMENLTVRNYYTVNRFIGLDYYHAKKALDTLARYHALGIVTRHKQPEFFETAKAIARINNVHVDVMNDILNDILELLRQLPIFGKYLTIIEKSFEFFKKNENGFNKEADEPWATLTHGDYWCNNLMFHRNEENNEIDDVKFCDFQMYKYQSPLRDLGYFLFPNLNEETETKYFDDLLNSYHKSFVQTLKLMDCRTDDFTKEKFDLEFKKQATIHFPLYVLSTKFITFDATDVNDNKEFSNSAFGNVADKRYMDKLYRILNIYEKKNLFSKEYLN